MTVLPGSLDYLYYNGILDHIPYEAYQTTTPMNGSQYLNQAQQGLLYNTYTSPDTFVRSNLPNNNANEKRSFAEKAFGYNDGYGKSYDFEEKAFGPECKSFRDGLVESAEATASGFSNAPTFLKGLISGGIMVGTLCLLLRGKKKPPVNTQANTQPKTSFLSKFNPFNWFKKK